MESLVSATPVSPQARRRVRTILLTLTGHWSVHEGYAHLGVSRTRFQDLRRKMLAGAGEALEERPAGRPRRRAALDAEEADLLRGQVTELRRELRRVRAELDLARGGAATAIQQRLFAKAVRS